MPVPNGSGAWVECNGTRHQWSGPDERRRGPNRGIGAWTVAMETDSKPTRWKRGGLQATWGVEDLVPGTLHPRQNTEQRAEGLEDAVVNYKWLQSQSNGHSNVNYGDETNCDLAKSNFIIKWQGKRLTAKSGSDRPKTSRFFSRQNRIQSLNKHARLGDHETFLTMNPPKNCNLEMLVFDERRKPEHLAVNLSEQSREPTTNSTHAWCRVRELIEHRVSSFLWTLLQWNTRKNQNLIEAKSDPRESMNQIFIPI